MGPELDQGCYLIVLSITEPLSMKIAGRNVALEAGRYAYAGSAQRGLRARVARHLKPPSEKRPRWHIDRLLEGASVEAVLAYPLSRPGECWLARRLLEEPGAALAARGFGSSDCRCPGHLLALSPAADLGALAEMDLPAKLILK